MVGSGSKPHPSGTRRAMASCFDVKAVVVRGYTLYVTGNIDCDVIASDEKY